MSSEIMRAYIAYGEPWGKDIDFDRVCDWAGDTLLQQQQDARNIQNLDPVIEGWNAAVKYAADHLHDVMMGLRYGTQSDDERYQFASTQIERCRDVVSGAKRKG